MRSSGIEWTGTTWNPGDGCDVVSPGCANCYAMRIAGRFSGPGRPYEGLVTIGKNKRAIWNGEVRFHTERLLMPLSWRRPELVFVNSMSDLFYRFTDEQIAAVYGVMCAAHWHGFQLLTKRADRLPQWYEWVEREARRSGGRHTGAIHTFLNVCAQRALDEKGARRLARAEVPHQLWPLPNLWLGVTVEDWKRRSRIDYLRQVPAAVRFVSFEPLLEDLGDLDLRDIDWAIIGCEAGPGMRPCEVDWIRAIIRQCKEQGVAVFLKQAAETADGLVTEGPDEPGGYPAVWCGSGSKRKPGGVIGAPYLDGRQYLEFPSVWTEARS